VVGKAMKWFRAWRIRRLQYQLDLKMIQVGKYENAPDGVYFTEYGVENWMQARQEASVLQYKLSKLMEAK
jgi:hypothetical protein